MKTRVDKLTSLRDLRLKMKKGIEDLLRLFSENYKRPKTEIKK